MSDRPRFIVVGGGLAGLMTVIKIAEAGHDVDVFSMVPCRRSHSVCAQGGINGAVNTKGEGDSPEIHFVDSIRGGDFLAHQPPVKAMCQAAPGIIYLLDRMGVPFSRTPEGLIDFRRFGGTLHHRTAFAGATTGQQLLYALDEQVRRHEAKGRVRRFERHELVHAVLDDGGRCRGIVAMDLATMQLEAFPAVAVCLATGGPGLLFGKSTNSFINTGTAASLVYQQGAAYANGEFIQVHPTAIAGPDKLRLISESLRGEGARVWVPKQPGDARAPAQIPTAERWYFLEEKYPKYKNLVPRDVASREIFVAVRDLGLGVGGKDAVFLDIVNPDREVSQGRGPEEIAQRVEGVVEIYEKFAGQDPREVPMQVFPAVHYSMGGLWVDYDHMTNIPGLFAAGEVDYQYHGANRLGANSLISCLYGGLVCGPRMVAYATGASLAPASSSLFEAEFGKMRATFDGLGKMNGPENPYRLWWELGAMMNAHVTVVRKNTELDRVDATLQEMMERWRKIDVLDSGKTANQAIMFVRHLWNMLCLARVITVGARLRDESRGAHYKPEFPERDDARFMKTTMAAYDPATHAPKITYEELDATLVKPVRRDYSGKAHRVKTVVLKIKRQDAAGVPPRWEEFEVPWEDHLNVHAALMAIQRNPVTRDGRKVSPVVWDAACLEEVCGSCTMIVNGQVRQACAALVDELEQPIELRPMTKFPLIRDLVVDRTRVFDDFKHVRAWIHLDGTHDLGPGPRQSQELADLRYALSRCMACGCCLEACPNYGPHTDYIGAAPINQVRLFNLHPSGKMHEHERLDALLGPGGISGCGNSQNCVEVCPKDIPLTDSLADTMRATTKHGLLRLLRR